MYLHMCMRITKDTDARTSVVPSLPVPALHFAADDPFPLLYDWPPPTLIHQCRVCSQLGFARARDSFPRSGRTSPTASRSDTSQRSALWGENCLGASP